MSIFKGAGTALVTPFNDKGINFAAFESLIEYQIENGIDALVVCGTTGEASTMTQEERESAIDFVVKQTAGRVPVIAGTGTNNTATSVDAAEKAADLGADALLVVTPYYNKCTDSGLIRHFYSIADAAKLPVLVYNIPGRTGFNICPSAMKELAAHEYIVGTKEASCNIAQIVEIARVCHNFDIYSGNDDHVVPIMSVGGLGVISVVSNVAPKMTHDMAEAYLNGDVVKARELQFKLNPLVKALFSEVNPTPIKMALNMIGIHAGIPRLPLTEMCPEKASVLRRELIALGYKFA